MVNGMCKFKVVLVTPQLSPCCLLSIRGYARSERQENRESTKTGYQAHVRVRERERVPARGLCEWKSKWESAAAVCACLCVYMWVGGCLMTVTPMASLHPETSASNSRTAL